MYVPMQQSCMFFTYAPKPKMQFKKYIYTYTHIHTYIHFLVPLSICEGRGAADNNVSMAKLFSKNKYFKFAIADNGERKNVRNMKKKRKKC